MGFHGIRVEGLRPKAACNACWMASPSIGAERTEYLWRKRSKCVGKAILKCLFHTSTSRLPMYNPQTGSYLPTKHLEYSVDTFGDSQSCSHGQTNRCQTAWEIVDSWAGGVRGKEQDRDKEAKGNASTRLFCLFRRVFIDTRPPRVPFHLPPFPLFSCA